MGLSNELTFEECLRDIGLEDEALRLAIRRPSCLSMRFAHSVTGWEYGRVQAWGENPAVAAKVKETSPSEYCDLTQRHLEPLLVRFALIVDPAEPDLGNCSGKAGDLGRALARDTLHTMGSIKPAGVKACNVLLRADLNKYMNKERVAALHWVANPGFSTFPGLIGHLRAVRPCDEWVMVAFGPGGSNPFEGLELSDPKLVACVREMVGDDSLPVEIIAMDPWTVRESVATEYSKASSDAYLLGDAAHRHPPAVGLGSNTCIQDAYNLAWKVAFVSKGVAGPSLLQTYSQERQPVGAALVRESNTQLNPNNALWSVLGLNASSAETDQQEVSELGRQRMLDVFGGRICTKF
ncbi:2,4-dichlorophenol 6-monooxygenase [Colletotrichum kahawae]|uniref:2,4-dichlorophenol 6-monooxygenase n=1 Tax=Colletotrichum kahawae TaxID=34407 RepID=A0AAD9Y539_COLKA|nr:2,4-dichlorophenol 6-monooxygenase [Colletotrichum kahawae]